MAEINGATIIARALKEQGVQTMYGVVGIPVSGIAVAAQREGIAYYGMRHEMPATYAAQATGYMTGRPGVGLVVSGPGVLNAVGAFSNAWANRWPMLLLGGASDSTKVGMGDFQEAEQVAALAPYAKWAVRVESMERLPQYIARGVKEAISGTPGPVYIELPGNMIMGSTDEEKVEWAPYVANPPRLPSDPQAVEAAVEALKSAEQPLIIIGKGVAYARADEEIRRFVETTGIPFLSMPMAKGVIPDDHDQSVAAARSFVLENSDVIFLAAARLNWMLHFGLPPRFRKDVRVVQLDINQEEIGRNVPAEVALTGDAKVTLGQILDYLDEHPWQFPQDSEWLQTVRAQARENQEMVEGMVGQDGEPMGYYTSLMEVKKAAPRDVVYVTEGEGAMAIARTVLDTYEPRQRLDAGSFGSMGLGHGFAIAAQVENPSKRVICVQGDSAFGFAGMECEVAARYKLPITWVIINNNGIGGAPLERFQGEHLPPNGLGPGVRYDLVMEGVGGKGYHAETPEALGAALREALTLDGPSLINVPIDPQSKRKPQRFGWLTR